MDTTMIIAIIAGVVSLTGAFITWYQTERIKKLEVRTQESLAKLTSETQVEIEKLKLEKEKVIHALEVSEKKTEERKKALSNFWSCLQQIKEEIKIILHDDFGSLDKLKFEEFRGFKLGVKIFQSLYMGRGVELSPIMAATIHDTKNLLVNIDAEISRIRHSLDGKKDSSLYEPPKISKNKQNIYEENLRN